jgi:phosphate transport system substrate-binding protein
LQTYGIQKTKMDIRLLKKPKPKLQRSGIHRRKSEKPNAMKQKLLTLVTLMLCSVLFTACPRSPEVDPEPPIHEELELTRFIPFSHNNLLATLPREASIQIRGDLPRLDGATALYPVYAAFVQATYPPTENYRDLERGVVRNTTTSNAFINLINGDVDIIFTAPPSQEQVRMAAEKDLTFNSTPIGRDAFVFFVNKNNPVYNLTSEQIRGIYSGAITNWRDVGGHNIEILAYQRPAGSGSQTALELIMGETPIMNPPVDRMTEAMGMIIEEVAGFRNHGNAIGFTFLFFATQMVKNNEIRLLAINGVLPTKETIRSGEYPFSDSFYAITTGNKTENMKKLIEWILSEEGQYLIDGTGYVSIE